MKETPAQAAARIETAKYYRLLADRRRGCLPIVIVLLIAMLGGVA